MTKTTLRGAFAATTALSLIASTAMAEDYTKYGIKADVPGTCSFEAIDAKDYTGRTLNIITHAIPVIGEPTALHAQQFQELTGATVNVVHVPFGDLFQRIMIPFQTQQAAYDVLARRDAVDSRCPHPSRVPLHADAPGNARAHALAAEIPLAALRHGQGDDGE